MEELFHPALAFLVKWLVQDRRMPLAAQMAILDREVSPISFRLFGPACTATHDSRSRDALKRHSIAADNAIAPVLKLHCEGFEPGFLCCSISRKASGISPSWGNAEQVPINAFSSNTLDFMPGVNEHC